MNKDRLWFIGAGAAFVIIALLGWTLGISPLVDQATAANAQTATITATNTASQLQLQKLKSEYTNIDQFKTELAELRQSIPSDASLAAFLKEINALCDANGVKLTSVGISDATLYVNPNASTATSGSTDAAGSTATPTPTPTPTPTAGATTGTTTTTTTGSNPGDFVLLPVTIVFTGSFADVMGFTGGVQTGPRLFVSNSFSVQRLADDNGGSTYTSTIVGTVFALKGLTPDTVQIVVPDATPDPTPTDTATPDPTDTATAPPTGAPTNTPTAPATTKP